MSEAASLSKGKEKRIKSYIEGYALAMGIPPAKKNMSFRQHVIRFCHKSSKIAKFVRPTGKGKVDGEQTARLVKYMLDNPIAGYSIPSDILSGSFKTKKIDPVIIDVNPNRKIENRIKKNTRNEEALRRSEFYKSWDWKQVRYDALKKHGAICMCCGAKRTDFTIDGSPVRIVVDHVMPISRFWHLRLEISNLQILCEDCNLGKGARDTTDFRGQVA